MALRILNPKSPVTGSPVTRHPSTRPPFHRSTGAMVRKTGRCWAGRGTNIQVTWAPNLATEVRVPYRHEESLSFSLSPSDRASSLLPACPVISREWYLGTYLGTYLGSCWLPPNRKNLHVSNGLQSRTIQKIQSTVTISRHTRLHVVELYDAAVLAVYAVRLEGVLSSSGLKRAGAERRLVANDGPTCFPAHQKITDTQMQTMAD